MTGFKPYIGKKISNQNKLNQRFIALHAEPPAPNDIQAAMEPDTTAIFDGQFWRELDLKALNQSVNQDFQN